MDHPKVDKSTRTTPRTYPHGVRGDLFLTLLPLHKPKKGLSTDLIRTSAPATSFTKTCCTTVFSSGTILPISVHDEGWKPSAQSSKLFPKQIPSLLPAKGSSHLQSCICCADSQHTHPAPPKGHGKRQRGWRTKMCRWERGRGRSGRL